MAEDAGFLPPTSQTVQMDGNGVPIDGDPLEFMRKKAKEFIKMAEKVPGSEAYAYASRGSLYVAMNKPDKAEEYLKKLLSAKNSLPGQPVQASLANLYAALDRPDEMFQCLNKSIEIKEGSALYIWGFPEFKKFRSDPRFAELM